MPSTNNLNSKYKQSETVEFQEDLIDSQVGEYAFAYVNFLKPDHDQSQQKMSN